MRFVALHAPIYGGKTTLALSLAGRGFRLVSFTDSLKAEVAKALTRCGVATTVNDITHDKEKYRRLLQEFGHHIGFDDDPRWVYKALEGWEGGPLVFDNPRTDAQAKALHTLGISVVELVIPRAEQVRRAAAKGVTEAELDEKMAHDCEQGISRELIDVRLDGTLAPLENAEILDAFWDRGFR